MDDLKGIKYLRQKLERKRVRVRLRYAYYEGKALSPSNLTVIPPWLRNHRKSSLGWCTRSVDALADRLVFRGFDENTDIYSVNSIFEANNPNVLYRAAIKESLIGACAFFYITHGDLLDEKGRGMPKVTVLTAADATGVMDEHTGFLKEGYAVLDRDEYGKPLLEAYFAKGATIFYEGGKELTIEESAAQYPLLVPAVYRADSKRLFGHSRISRPSMYIQDKAEDTLELMNIASEFYAFPQKYVSGTDPNSDPMDSWKASITSLLWFDKDEAGDHPVLGQFQQATMTPYIEQMRMWGQLFSGETGLTSDDLGFVTDNPSSAESIKATHENLRLMARDAQRGYSSAFANAGYIAACVRDNEPYAPEMIPAMRGLWEPVFEPDASALSTVGDGAIKINQAVPGYFNRENLRELTGIESAEEPVGLEPEEIEEVVAE